MVSFCTTLVFIAVQLGLKFFVNLAEGEQVVFFESEEEYPTKTPGFSKTVVDVTLVEADLSQTFWQAAFWAGVQLAAVVVLEIFLQAAI